MIRAIREIRGSLLDLKEWLDRTPGPFHWSFAVAAWIGIIGTIIRQLSAP